MRRVGEGSVNRSSWHACCDSADRPRERGPAFAPSNRYPKRLRAISRCSREGAFTVGALAAGRHGIGMLSIGGTSDEALKAHANNWSLYEESARKHGKTPDRRNWRIVTFAHVAETAAQARADMKFGLENFRKYFAEVATFPIVPPDVTGDPAEYLTSTGLAC